MSRQPDIHKFVRTIQAATQETAGKGLETIVEDANRSLPGAKKLKLRLLSDARSPKNAQGRALRVTCPTRTIARLDLEAETEVGSVEFFLTRPREDGVAETRLIGTARYPDGDGSWNVSFQTERFARKPDDPVIIHGEALDTRRNVLAAIAVAVVE